MTCKKNVKTAGRLEKNLKPHRCSLITRRMSEDIERYKNKKKTSKKNKYFVASNTDRDCRVYKHCQLNL